MFKQNNRLTKNKDIERVFRHGQAYYTNLLGIKAVENNLDKVRITVIINNKVSKKAVVRNKIKRQIRQILKQFELKAGFDIIVVCLPLVVNQEYQLIKISVQKALNSLKLI